VFTTLFHAKAFHADDDERHSIPIFQETAVLIRSVELVALPGAPSYQEKVYRAHLDNGDEIDLFQAHWDVPLPPESLVGLSVKAARTLRNDRMLAVAQGYH
jgi:hypothetical protein